MYLVLKPNKLEHVTVLLTVTLITQFDSYWFMVSSFATGIDITG